MIIAENLTKHFDDFVAVDSVSLSISPGEILVLLGPNGAGKTTTVRMLSAILHPTAGRAIVGGHDVTQNPDAVRQTVGLLTEYPGLYLRMRGSEYLDFFGHVYRVDATTRRERGRQLLEQFGMPEAWDRRIGEFSKGMQQKMALARALLHDPSVLLLDEPTSAMDPYSAKLVRDAILSLQDQRRAIMVCTHNLAEAELLADRIAFIRAGRIVATGTSAELKQQFIGPQVMEVRYNGSTVDAAAVIARLVPVVDGAPGWVHYATTTPETINPLILHALAEAGVQVITLSPQEQSLESVYLRVVTET